MLTRAAPQQLNKILSSWNIEKQICESNDKVPAPGVARLRRLTRAARQISYFIADITYKTDADLVQLENQFAHIAESILTRILTH
jgi:hypothetical protein